MTIETRALPVKKLSSNQIQIEPLQPGDFERLFQIASDPLIWEQHPSSDRYKREVFRKYFDGAIESKSAFTVFDKATGDLIGSSRYYDFNPAESKVAIGYTFLTRKYWGGSYNFALKKIMLDYAFDFVNSVLFHVGTSNFRSQKAVLKLGAQKIRDVDFDYYGSKLLHFEYEITKEQWGKKTTMSSPPKI